MKGLFLTAAFGVVCISAFGQTLNFANAGVGFTARVTDTDGTTGLLGSAWSADLYWAPGTVTDSTLLTALNQPTTFSTVPAQAGFFFGGVRTVPLVPYGRGIITAQVRVWDTASGNSWAVAAATPGARVGESILFQLTLPNPFAVNPGVPVSMGPLNGHPWSVSIVGVPEPSTLALAGLGLAAMVVLRRRRVVLSLLFAATCCSGFGQGTLNFANAGVGFSAKITDTAGNGLAGSAWDVDLYWAAGTVANSTLLAALGAPATFSTVPSQAGYFFGGTRTVPLTPYGSGVITAQLRVWEAAYGSTWLQASTTPGAQIGTSVLFQVTLGNPNTTPPGIPATMIGLNGLPFQTEVPSLVPEPSALALAGLGFAAMLALRRRRPS